MSRTSRARYKKRRAERLRKGGREVQVPRERPDPTKWEMKAQNRARAAERRRKKRERNVAKSFREIPKTKEEPKGFFAALFGW